ncbi:MAG: universal stress protein [Chloroflexi bacterium AL-W]|nr:universal stress protein [Chloroflexi bacterium AL-N1]NOK67397.1 universal stress protein [Chloroflexi bacterium AL-N10]NOK75111.1 universal stress protein [Chloroflexi bacterium AL-N5]NOK81898.1 universal stress protein [Chloroflexi bacterium AL-W]NOK89744.1 universal stress protein [Chloroflexi bacterium AL-N15]
MYRSILVPLDTSPFSEHALVLARGMAQQTGAKLTLVHVHKVIEPIFIGTAPIYDEINDGEHRAKELAYLDQMQQKLISDDPLIMTTELLDELPVAEALYNYTMSTDIDLIMMTTHGRGALSRFWLGSVADSLVRRVTVPVLLVRPHETEPDFTHEPRIKHVLIPLDGSGLSEQIIAQAINIGRMNHARYTLLHTIEPVITSYATAPHAATFGVEWLDQTQSQAKEYIEQTAQRLRNESFSVKTEVLVGPPAATILDYADTNDVDMIALATHGRSGMARLLLGSVADKVVRGATVPVLVQRPHSEE